MNIKLVQRTKEFIENYHHINYCEVIIHPDGTIEEARPSHTESLMRYMALPREVIYELMPISDSPISWLVRKTECVAVWYEHQLLPFEEITKAQQYVLKELASANKIKLNTSIVRIEEDVLSDLGVGVSKKLHNPYPYQIRVLNK